MVRTTRLKYRAPYRCCEAKKRQTQPNTTPHHTTHHTAREILAGWKTPEQRSNNYNYNTNATKEKEQGRFWNNEYRAARTIHLGLPSSKVAANRVGDKAIQ